MCDLRHLQQRTVENHMPVPLPNQRWSLTKDGVALVTQPDGTIAAGSSGIYIRDRRIVAGMRLLVDGIAAVQLSGARVDASRDRLTYGYWTTAADPQAVIIRERSLTGGYTEELTVQCFRHPIEFVIEIELEAGGATIYHLDEEAPCEQDIEFVASALWTKGCSADRLTVSAAMAVEPGEELTFSWGLRLDVNEAPIVPAAKIRGSDRRMQLALDNARWDLEALTIVDPRTLRPFLAAGAPHFLAIFGRDALMASLLTMLADSNRALDTLDVLAAYQGTTHDPRTLEAPGRILHELRIGDMSVFGLDPGVPYYGSVDATPLFPMLLAECLRWGAPAERLRRLLPAARSAVQWCRDHVDQYGFVQSRPHDRGIDNQGWKDSGDSVVRPDGTVVREATSLVEVQGYVHEAFLGLADLEDALGEPASAVVLRREATEFAAKFLKHFKVGGGVHLAMALDAAGQTVAVRASNVGHLLATGLIDDTMAKHLSNRLFSAEEFSGWGVRTLSASEAAFNPLGYHVGSVWPHDNAMLLRGLARRGLHSETVRLSNALLDLAAADHHTLPELLSGFDRARFPEPVPYPASARPQAWAAAVPFQIVTSLLGLRPALHQNQLALQPVLEPDQTITVTDLRLGERTLRIDAQGSEATVTGDTNGLEITIGP